MERRDPDGKPDRPQTDGKDLKICGNWKGRRRKGALPGGVQAKEGELEKGCFLRPTLLGDVTNDMRVAQEEIFGPVACIIKFKTEEEVLAMANDSAYGLGGAVWTRDINRALRVARGVETGRMWSTPTMRSRKVLHLAAARHPVSEERPIRSSWNIIPR